MPMPKKTNAEKKVTGTYRPCKDGYDDPPEAISGRPDAPKTLTEYQVGVFNRICDLLEMNDWLKFSDGETIESYSVIKSRLELDQESFTAADFTQLRMLANELGLSPAARAKMPVKAPKKEENDFDNL
jgi:phage terminase small subunit